MSLWDELKKRFLKTGTAIQKEAGRQAMNAAVAQVKEGVQSAADGFLDGLESDLAAAEQKREGRQSFTPSSEDPIADQIITQYQTADQQGEGAEPSSPSAAPSAMEQRAARRARAEAELAALKRRMEDSESSSGE